MGRGLPAVARPVRGRRLLATLAAGAVLVACSAPAASPRPAPESGRPHKIRATVGATTAAPTPTPRQGRPTRPPADVRIAVAGDVHFAGRLATRLAHPATALAPIARALSAADITMVNLETAITGRGVPEPKEFHFRAPATALAALRSAGVDVATMANNHAVDYGPEGLADSLAAIRSSRFPVVGIGSDAARAYAPYTTTVRGQRVAILAASQIQDHTLEAWTATGTGPGIASAFSDRLVSAVRQARRHAAIVLVYVHWGEEGDGCPLPVQRELARRLSDAGAAAVVGTHAHLLLGAGWLGRTYVDYGMGNYVWWRDNAYSNDTGVLTLSFRHGRVVRAALAPAYIDPRGLPMPIHGADAAGRVQAWAALRGCTGLAAAPTG